MMNARKTRKGAPSGAPALASVPKEWLFNPNMYLPDLERLKYFAQCLRARADLFPAGMAATIASAFESATDAERVNLKKAIESVSKSEMNRYDIACEVSLRLGGDGYSKSELIDACDKIAGDREISPRTVERAWKRYQPWPWAD